MNWPTAITICVCAVCVTLIVIGFIERKNNKPVVKRDNDITNY